VIVNRVALGAIARREGPVAKIVEKIVAVVQAALVAKGVPIGDPGAAVKVDPDTRVDRAAAVDGRLKGSRKSN